MLFRKTIVFPTLAAALALSGCGTSAHRIDPSTDGITTVQEINAMDWQNVSAKAVDSLLASGALVRQDGRKSIVMINTVRNNTGVSVNPHILTGKIRQALLRSGKAVTTTAVGASGAEDTATRQVRELENDDLFNQQTVQKRGTVLAPDISLSGEIVREMARSGRTSESHFFFHIVATDLKTGLAVWEDTFDISKQETSGVF